MRFPLREYFRHHPECEQGLPSAGRPCTCEVKEVMEALIEDQEEMIRLEEEVTRLESELEKRNAQEAH